MLSNECLRNLLILKLLYNGFWINFSLDILLSGGFPVQRSRNSSRTWMVHFGGLLDLEASTAATCSSLFSVVVVFGNIILAVCNVLCNGLTNTVLGVGKCG